MIEINVCDECGANIKYRIAGSTQGWLCTQCKWSLVTTYIPEICKDKTQYKMHLLSAEQNNKNQIRAVAKVANINFLQAKKIIQEQQPLIIESDALTIDRTRKIFDNLAIKYTIHPNFPY